MRCSLCGDESADYPNLVAINEHRRDVHADAVTAAAQQGAATAAKTRAAKTSRTRRRTTPAVPDASAGGGDDQRVPTADDDTAGHAGHPDETAPGYELVPDTKRTLKDRLWGRRDNTPAPAKRKRVPRRSRTSTAGVIEMLWGGAGFVFNRAGDPAVGRVMQFQAPSAGLILEELTKDTALDVPLQFLASRATAAEAAANLVGLPVLVFMYERANEEMRPMLEAMLRSAVQRQFVALVPAVKKAREEERKWRDAVADLGLVGEDPVGDLLNVIFTPDLAPDEPPASDAANNGRADQFGPVIA